VSAICRLNYDITDEEVFGEWNNVPWFLCHTWRSSGPTGRAQDCEAGPEGGRKDCRVIRTTLGPSRAAGIGSVSSMPHRRAKGKNG